MSITEQYTRKNAQIEAVRVNLAELMKIAKWCGGHVRATDALGGDGKMYIHVKVVPSKFRNRRTQAFIGDWIVKDSDGFKIYENDAFRSTFHLAARDTDKYSEILKIVKLAMLEQDSTTYHQDGKDMTLIAKASAQLILEIVDPLTAKKAG